VYSSNVTEQIEGIRRQAVAVLDGLLAKAGGSSWRTPRPPSGDITRS
jgi:hypothetical protein